MQSTLQGGVQRTVWCKYDADVSFASVQGTVEDGKSLCV